VPATVLVGAQWGDEGKGKITDLLAPEVDLIVRYQGGNNAGHTVIAGDVRLALHLVPSGILRPTVTPVIGDGVVVDPATLLEEIDALATQGISCERLLVSGNAHLIMPYHRELDKVTERYLGRSKLGTTRRGIGPAYADKAARIGLRVQDLLDIKIFGQKLEVALKEKNAILSKIYNRLPLDAKVIIAEYEGYAQRLEPYISDTSLVVSRALRDGRNVLCEGAQGTLLDVDHGTYPFVTSSSTVIGGALIGTGLAPRHLTGVLGIVRTYTTRVGEGPFPTEMLEGEAELGQMIRERGREYGASTGRPRRCGWFDAFATRYAAEINGFTSVALTKLDVLDTLDEIKVCVGYNLDGERCESLPSVSQDLRRVEPVFATLPGWKTSTLGMTEMDALPANARRYVDFLSQQIGVEIGLVSTGPERTQTIIVKESNVGRWLQR
jgi:adenylosuccinate synthase